MKIFGLTLAEWGVLAGLAAFLWKVGGGAVRGLKAGVRLARDWAVDFVKGQFGAVMAKLEAQDQVLCAHGKKLDDLFARVGELEGIVAKGCTDGAVIREASARLEQAAEESTKAAKTLQDIAVKFSDPAKKADFGKVILKE
jgi:hypothetical protein